MLYIIIIDDACTYYLVVPYIFSNHKATKFLCPKPNVKSEGLFPYTAQLIKLNIAPKY